MSVTLVVAGGKHLPISIIEELPVPDRILAANGGYDVALNLGLQVDVLVGDLDSLRPGLEIPDTTAVIRHPVNKDATDLELALEYSLRHDPSRVVLIGGEGGRFDHEVSALAVLASERWAGVPEIDWVRSDGTLHIVRGSRRVHGDVGAIISLISAHGGARAVSTSGLKWPLDGADLIAGSSLGTSNEFERPTATIKVGSGVVYAIIPRECSDRESTDH